MMGICPTCGHQITDVNKQPRCPRCHTLLKEIPKCATCESECTIHMKIVVEDK